ncbi:MAG: HEAT repeat domain-containing protein [Polyangiales bacterium]
MRFWLAVLFVPVLMAPLMGFEWEGRIGRLERQYSGGSAAERQQAVRMLGAYGAAEVRTVLLRALEDPESSVRIEAANTAGRVKLTDAVAILTGWLEDLESEVRTAAARALGAIGDARPLPLLVRALGDADAGVRRAAIGALAAIGAPEAVVPMLGRLDDEDMSVRVAAAQALGHSGDARAVVPLIGRARDTPEMRTAVYQALAELGDPRGASALIQGLRDDDENARISAIAALGRVGSERAMRPLAELAHETDPRAAEAAIQAIGNIPGPIASQTLVELLGDATLRQATSGVLVVRADPALTLHLAEVLARTPPLEMPPYARVLEARLAAKPVPETAPLIAQAMNAQSDGDHTLLNAVALSGDPSVLPRVLGALGSAPGVALDALESYFRLHPGDGRAADPLLAALPLVAAPSRARVVRLLGRVGAERTSPALITLAASESEELRQAAVEAMGRTGGEGVVEALLGHLRDGEEAALRHDAALGLARLGRVEDLSAILERLEAPPPVDRHAYLVALAGIAQRHGLGDEGARFARLAEVFMFGHDPDLAARIVETLGAWGNDDALELLRRAPLERLPAAVMALGDHAEGESFVLAHLSHTSPRVRAAAAGRAGEFGARALPDLLARLDEGSWPEPAAASFAIARIALRGEVPESAGASLCQALTTRDPAARANLLLALSQLQTRCDDMPVLRWTQLPHAAAVRGAARRYLAAHGQEFGVECERESHRNVAPLCQAIPESTYDEDVELYVYDRERQVSRNALVSLWLADGTVLVAPTDARGFVSLRRAPRGRVIATDPLRTALEP